MTAIHRKKRASDVTVTDQFCGAGGSSIGARRRGLRVRMALNHWKRAIETHQTNFPDTDHDCTDISACDPRRYPSTDILITSPECTTHSPAGGSRKPKMQRDLFLPRSDDAEAERSRATMYDVCRFAEIHEYNIIIVENVVEAYSTSRHTRWSRPSMLGSPLILSMCWVFRLALCARRMCDLLRRWSEGSRLARRSAAGFRMDSGLQQPCPRTARPTFGGKGDGQIQMTKTERRAAGLCWDCDESVAEGRTRCTKHLRNSVKITAAYHSTTKGKASLERQKPRRAKWHRDWRRAEGRFAYVRRAAIRRGLAWTLTKFEYAMLITGNCAYCGLGTAPPQAL
jgi:hypothetical protein